MKKSKFAVMLLSFALFLVLGISGCNQSTSPTTNTDSFLSNAVVANIQDDVSDVTDPSVDNNHDMSLMPKYDRNQCFQKPMMGDNMLKPGFINFVGIMRKLNLTELQKTSIKTYFADYRDCISAAQTVLRASEKTILYAANIQRKAVMDSLSSSLYTKTQARTRLQQIAKGTRTTLQNNPDLADFKLATCTCLQTLFSDIKATLNGPDTDTTSQLYIWNTWVSDWVTKTKNTCIIP